MIEMISDDISIKDIDDLDSGNDDGDGVQQRRTAIVVAQPGILAGLYNIICDYCS